MKISWDSLQMELEFETPGGFKVEIYKNFDFEKRPITELEILILDVESKPELYLYWQCDELCEADFTENFVKNLSNSIDENVYRIDGELESSRPDFTWVEKSGKLRLMPLERKLVEEAKIKARKLSQQYFTDKLLENQRTYIEKLYANVGPSPVDSILSIVRTQYPYITYVHEFPGEQSKVPEKPIITETVKVLKIVGGPCHDLVNGFTIKPWKLVLQQEERPVDPPSAFYFVPTLELEVWDTHPAVAELPAWKSLLWNFRCWLYNIGD